MRRQLAGLWMLCVTMLPLGAQAGSFEVAPTTIKFSADSRYSSLFVTNRSNDPVTVQVEAFEWKQTDKGDELVATKSLIMSPPLMQLAPGRKQTVRLALLQNAKLPKEQSYRLVISQLPSNGGAQGVEVLLQFSVPVFVPPAEKNTRPGIEWSAAGDAGGLTLTVHNSGGQHAKLLRLMLTGPDGRDVDVSSGNFQYVLPDASHSWKVNLPSVQPGEQVAVKAQDETEGEIHATVTVASGL